VQSANATNSASDRQALNDEVRQRIDEIDRISTQTAFNGLKVLDGTFGSAAFQVGANAGETISVDLTQSTRAGSVGNALATQALDYDPGTTALADGDSLSVTVGSGSAQTINLSSADNTLQKAIDTINGQLDGATAVLNADEDGIEIRSTEALTVDVSSATGVTADAGDTVALTADADSLDTVNVSTVYGANDAILRVDDALDTVNSLRGELGAVQNRFESTIANLSTSVENLSASNSRILDADFAAETAKLSKAQVLQQAGISVLAQANARPQQVLSLLQ
jgi:flagellin